jgi:hypothetical protein
MSDVRGFLLNLFEDLRARRLLPVAALLVAGLVAVPVLLSKKAEEPSVPPVEPSGAQSASDRPKGPEALAQVRLEELEKGTGSSLSAFDESNPFAPPAKVVQAAKEQASGDVPGAPTGGEVAPLGGGTTGTGDTGGAPDQGGGTGDGGDGGDGGGDTKTTEFTYVIDVTFWSNGRERKIKGLEKLDVLPGPAEPLLIFMGVTDKGGNAVFLVDSTLTASGEGSCQPSADDCAMVHVGPGSEERFVNDIGDVYQLRIDQIRKVKVGEDAEAAASKKDKQGKTAKAAVGSDGPSRRFVPPIITDFVVVTEEDNSTGAGKRR